MPKKLAPTRPARKPGSFLSEVSASSGCLDNWLMLVSLVWLGDLLLAHLLNLVGLGFLHGQTLHFSLMLNLAPARDLTVDSLIVVQG